MTVYDICVFGGGPAGSTIAKKLAQFGYAVVIIEKEIFPRPNIGLSLTPGIHHWLDLLGVKDGIDNAGFSKALTSFVLWEDDRPIRKDLDPDKAGYHVDRGQFDEILLRSAASEGVKIIQPSNLQSLNQDELGNWKITLSQNSCIKSLSVRFIVEATGRKSIQKGTKRNYLPPTIATYAYWDSPSIKHNFSFIESGENQWFWGAPLSELGYMACIFSDPKEIKAFSSVKDYYLNKIKKFTLFAPLLKSKNLRSISVCSATPYVDKEPVFSNYIKVGDSAFSMDPLSSQGVQKAIKSGFQGAIVVNTLLSKKENSKSAIDFYNKMVQTEVSNHTIWTKQFYNRQNRFKGGGFWESRKDDSIKTINPINEINISLKKEDRLFINKDIVITRIPVAGKSLVECRDGITIEGIIEPFVFLQNVPVLPMIQKMDDRQLIDGLMVIKYFMPQSNPKKVLQWLIYNNILCTDNIQRRFIDNNP